MSEQWGTIQPGSFYDCGESNVVYFDSASGDTHLLSAFSAHVLRQLQHRTLSTDALLAELLADVEPQGQAELAAALPRLLEQLAGLGVVYRH